MKKITLKPTDVIKGAPDEVRAKYSQFYSTRDEDSEWMDKWQNLVENVHIKKRPYVVQEIIKYNFGSICDLGCGTGDLLKEIRIAGFRGQLVGIDIYIPKRLKELGKGYNIEIQRADFKKVKQAYDAMIFFSSLHYATLPEVKQILINLAKCKNFYIIEAFIEHPENSDLDSKIREKTHDKCHLFHESALDNIFLQKGYKIELKYQFPKDTDLMARMFSLTYYKK